MLRQVLITPRLTRASSYDETRDSLDIRWTRMLSDLGVMPIIVPITSRAADYFDAFEVAGLILTGGNDVSEVGEDPLSSLRDDAEKSMLALAIERDVPVLGVCRGLQLINVALGGSLVAVEGHAGARHRLVAEPGTRFSSLVGRIESVNSFHDWGIEEVAPDLAVVARSPDGYVEAAMHRSARIFGQMWHPEREAPWDSHSLELIEEVLAWRR